MRKRTEKLKCEIYKIHLQKWKPKNFKNQKCKNKFTKNWNLKNWKVTKWKIKNVIIQKWKFQNKSTKTETQNLKLGKCKSERNAKINLLKVEHKIEIK